MLKAIQYNKSKNQVFSGIEDTLTATVFQLLVYLPDDLLWNIIKASIKDHTLPQEVGELKEINFWPHWDAAGTNNANFIEPDVFLSFEKLDIIVEAKRWNTNQQSKEQWEKELQAYKNVFQISPDDNDSLEIKKEKMVILWALGGIRNFNSESIKIGDDEKLVVKSSWDTLLLSIKKEFEQLNTDGIKSSNKNGMTRIFQDLVDSFALHGFFIGTWLNEPGIEKYQLSSPPSYLQLIKMAEKFDRKKWFYSMPHYMIKNESLEKLKIWRTI